MLNQEQLYRKANQNKKTALWIGIPIALCFAVALACAIVLLVNADEDEPWDQGEHMVAIVCFIAAFVFAAGYGGALFFLCKRASDAFVAYFQSLLRKEGSLFSSLKGDVELVCRSKGKGKFLFFEKKRPDKTARFSFGQAALWSQAAFYRRMVRAFVVFAEENRDRIDDFAVTSDCGKGVLEGRLAILDDGELQQ